MPADAQQAMHVGFAVTEHCNLRCPHCIRDDVTTVRSLDVDLFRSVVDQARRLFGDVLVSMTGGEPLLHPEFEQLVSALRHRRIPYRFVSNGWHLPKLLPSLAEHLPEGVRLSLSGASEEVHDAERGRGSFRRVLQSVAVLTSRRVPTVLTMVVDERDRHQIHRAADLAESLGCVGMHFILPQPVPGSAGRGSDPSPETWSAIHKTIQDVAAEPHRRTLVRLDYGNLLDDPSAECDTFALRRVYIDTRGRLCTCCQLSHYGFNETEVVADLNRTDLATAWPEYVRRIDELRRAQAPNPLERCATDRFGCFRCAKCSGKLDWLRQYPKNPLVAVNERGTVAATP